MLKKKFLLFLCLFTIIFFSQTINLKAAGWGFYRNSNHQTPEIGKYAKMIEGTSSYYVGDTSKKVVYLTFDAGYDNGELCKILSTLKQKNVKASFFVTGDFVKRFSNLTKQMDEEGHIVCNHSYSHKKIQTLSKDELQRDLNQLEMAYESITGKKMVQYFRPPEGEFTREALLNLQSLGYKTVFWSVAYRDWDTNHQQSIDKVKCAVLNHLHPGAIILLHSVSSSNSESLGVIIDEIRKEGYTFQTVLDL